MYIGLGPAEIQLSKREVTEKRAGSSPNLSRYPNGEKLSYFLALTSATVFGTLNLVRTRLVVSMVCPLLPSPPKTAPQGAVTLLHTPYSEVIIMALFLLRADLFFQLLIRFFNSLTICRAVCIVSCGSVDLILFSDVFVFLAFMEMRRAILVNLINDFVGSFVGGTFCLLFALTEVGIGFKANENRIGLGD